MHRMRRRMGGWAARLIVVAFGVVAFGGRVEAQAAASQGYVPGGSNNPVAFDELKWCEGGSTPGGACATSGDCGGGTCVTVWVQLQATAVPSMVVTRTQQRSVGTSAVDAFSTAARPCLSVRVKNMGATTLFVGWSGVTTSSGIPCLPGEYCLPMYPPNRDCNSVKIIGDAASGAAAVATP